ncbi:hypothetical protein [Corynebacterium striatum]|uniref:hypothetical protein n=1 Tax=Corynebacterium striatum TaxID=43770 RepID=UPI003F800243
MIDGTTYPETRYQLRGLPVPTTTNRQLGLVLAVEVAFGAVDLTIWKGIHGGRQGRLAGRGERPGEWRAA